MSRARRTGYVEVENGTPYFQFSGHPPLDLENYDKMCSEHRQLELIRQVERVLAPELKARARQQNIIFGTGTGEWVPYKPELKEGYALEAVAFALHEAGLALEELSLALRTRTNVPAAHQRANLAVDNILETRRQQGHVFEDAFRRLL